MNLVTADVLVVGGGPAGAALGLRLARNGRSVVLLERCAYGEFRVGESLPPGAVPRLRRLGVWESFLATRPVPVHGVKSAWGSGDLESSSFLASPFLNGWHLDRPRFDAMLGSAAEEAGTRVFRRTSAESIVREPSGRWMVMAVSPQGEVRVSSRFLVDATGRSARVCAQLGVHRRRVDNLVGIARLYGDPRAKDDLPSLVESHPLGWWYSSGLPDGRVVAILFTDADLCAHRGLRRPEAWAGALAESRHTLDRLVGRDPDGALQVFSASSHCLECAAGDGWLAIGDAVTSRDPLSSSGIEFALASAERASRVVCGESADLYTEDVHADFAAYLEERRAYYALERRWCDSTFWQRRHVVPSLGRAA